MLGKREIMRAISNSTVTGFLSIRYINDVSSDAKVVYPRLGRL